MRETENELNTKEIEVRRSVNSIKISKKVVPDDECFMVKSMVLSNERRYIIF